MPSGDATSVSPKAHSPNGERPGACEKTQRQRRRDRLKDLNTDGWRDGDRLTQGWKGERDVEL